MRHLNFGGAMYVESSVCHGIAQHAPNLQYLNMRGVRVTAEDARALLALRELRCLCLDNHRIRDEAFFGELFTECSHLRHVQLMDSAKLHSEDIVELAAELLPALELLAVGLTPHRARAAGVRSASLIVDQMHAALAARCAALKVFRVQLQNGFSACVRSDEPNNFVAIHNCEQLH